MCSTYAARRKRSKGCGVWATTLRIQKTANSLKLTRSGVRQQNVCLTFAHQAALLSPLVEIAYSTFNVKRGIMRSCVKAGTWSPPIEVCWHAPPSGRTSGGSARTDKCCVGAATNLDPMSDSCVCVAKKGDYG